MLNQKEDEIKQTVQQFDHEKQELQKVIEDVIKLTKQMKSSIKTNTVKDSATTVKKKAEPKKSPEKVATDVQTKPTEPVKAVENQSDGQLEFAEMLQADRQKEEVLKMHKQGKSVLEISKAMGMGQGEVKLIIGLYGA